MKSTVLGGTLAIVAALLWVVAADATQAPGGGISFKFWQDEQYRRELSLAADQIRRLEEIYQASAPQQKRLMQMVGEAEALLQQRIEQRDEKGAAEQIERVIDVRSDLMRERYKMLLKARFVLSSQQWTKFVDLQQKQATEKRALDKSQAEKSK
jgi:Spy/CpxP family protein refolding chaperone